MLLTQKQQSNYIREIRKRERKNKTTESIENKFQRIALENKKKVDRKKAKKNIILK